MAVQDFLRFLKAHKSSTSSNFVSLKGGKYNIPATHAKEFLELHIQALPFYTEQNAPSLAWRTPSSEFLPLIIDIDLEMKEDIQFKNEVFIELARGFMFYVGCAVKNDGLGVVLTRKQYTYTKQRDGCVVFKTGFHLYVFNALLSKSLRLQIREHIISELLAFCEEHSVVNPAEEVFDAGAATIGKSGLVMLGDYKKKTNTGMNYYICYRATYDWQSGEWTHAQHYTPDQTVDLLSNMRNIFYGWLWKTPEWEKFGDAATKAPVPPRSVDFPVQYNPSTFDLQRFLFLTKNTVPSNKEYTQLVMYCAAIQVPIDAVKKLMNDTWRPSDYDETERVYRAYKTKKETRASCIRYLNKHCKDPYTLAEIWKEPTRRFYNDYTEFSNVENVYFLNEVVAFLQDCVVFIYANNQFSWVYRIVKRDRHGNKIEEIHRQISKEGPFTGNDNFRVTLHPTKKQLIKSLKKAIPQKIETTALARMNTINALLECLPDLTNPVALERTRAILLDDTPEPQEKDVGSILKTLQMTCKLKRYTNITFRPYTGLVDPTPSEILNTFSGFPLLSYIPSHSVDIESTMIYKYLFDVWGWANPNKLMLNFVLNMLAFFVQYPAQRSEKMWLLVSKRQGTGKSFFYRIMQMLFQGYCTFHDSLDTLLHRFNMENNSLLVQHVDDVWGATQAQTRKLFPRVTCRTAKYEAKGERRLTLPEYSEFFITSNQMAPLHLCPNDRRQCLLEASALHIQVLGQVDAEIEDLDIAHAFFTFFRTRDISKWHPSMNPPSETKSKGIQSCMIRAHSFLTKFFADAEDWPRMYKPLEMLDSDWTLLYEITNVPKGEYRNQTRLRIERKRFYNLYNRFTRQFYSSSRPRNQDTFEKECEDAGVILHVAGRGLLINGKKKQVVDLYYSRVASHLATMYPELRFEWPHTSAEFANEFHT